MMTSQRSSLQKAKEKLSNGDGGSEPPLDGGIDTSSTSSNGEPMIQGSSESVNCPTKSQENSTNANNGASDNNGQFMPTTIKQ